MTKITGVLLTVLAMMYGSSAFSGEIYKWVDEGGKVHYSDQKPKHLEAQTISPEVNRMDSVNVKAIVMYSTSWCGYCQKAREFFKKRGIAYTEYDIEKDQIAKQRYDAIGGSGVPVILVNEKRMSGFSEKRLISILESD